MTGVRRGELLGLRWSDVNLGAGRVAIRQTVTDVEAELGFDDVKTARSRRTVDVDPVTVAAVKGHRRRQRELRLLVGPGWSDLDLVFCAPDGRAWHPDSISTAFARTISRLDVGRIRLHDLRHTHVTHLLAVGVNVKLVSERLGHALVLSRSTPTRTCYRDSRPRPPRQPPRWSTAEQRLPNGYHERVVTDVDVRVGAGQRVGPDGIEPSTEGL